MAPGLRIPDGSLNQIALKKGIPSRFSHSRKDSRERCALAVFAGQAEARQVRGQRSTCILQGLAERRLLTESVRYLKTASRVLDALPAQIEIRCPNDSLAEHAPELNFY